MGVPTGDSSELCSLLTFLAPVRQSNTVMKRNCLSCPSRDVGTVRIKKVAVGPGLCHVGRTAVH